MMLPSFICLGFEKLIGYQLEESSSFLLRKRNEAKKIALYICKNPLFITCKRAHVTELHPFASNE